MFPPAISPELARKFNLDDEPIPPIIRSKHGYETIIHSGNNWSTQVKTYTPGIGFKKSHFPPTINSHPVIEYSARRFIQNQLETAFTIRGTEALCRLLQSIEIKDSTSEKQATEEIIKWVNLSLQSLTAKEEATFTAIRNYVSFCVEEEYWAFNETLLWLIESATFKRAKSNASAFHQIMLDEDSGPYTQSQLVIIFQTAVNCELEPTERACLTLCRDLALRPIQLALLREEDFISDIRGCYLRVPRVKGYKRSALRRKSNNFVERPLSDNLANEIRLVIKNNKEKFRELDSSLKNLQPVITHKTILPARPLFPIKK